jgi:type I restriction enzyme S subunit
MSAWPEVELGTAIRPVQRPERPAAERSYRQLGVRWWGQGAYERDELDGAATRYASLSRVEVDDVVINKIWARHGGVAVVQPALNGCYVSGEFPLFTVNRGIADPAWIGWLTRWPEFWHRCDLAAQGTSGKNRIRPQRFLEIRVPLPPLEEQQTLVQRLVSIETLSGWALSTLDDSMGCLASALDALELAIWPSDSLVDAPTLGAVTSYLSRGRQSRQGESAHYLIKTQHVQTGKYVPTPLTLAPDVASRVSPEARVQSGDTLIACSAAGCLGRVARYDEIGRTASTDTHVAIARSDTRRVLPEYLYRYLAGTQGQRQLRRRERGDWQREKVGFRLTELNLRDLQQVPVPVPSLKEQARIVGYLRQVDQRTREVRRAMTEQRARVIQLPVAVLRHLLTT